MRSEPADNPKPSRARADKWRTWAALGVAGAFAAIGTLHGNYVGVLVYLGIVVLVLGARR